MKFFRRSIKHEYPFWFYDFDDSIFTDGCSLSFLLPYSNRYGMSKAANA